MADWEQVRQLRRGVNYWNAWRLQNPEVAIDLRQANLHGWNLKGVDLRGADLSGADIRGTIFRRADLSGANYVTERVIEIEENDPLQKLSWSISRSDEPEYPKKEFSYAHI